MARFLRTETNSSGGHSRLRPPTVVRAQPLAPPLSVNPAIDSRSRPKRNQIQRGAKSFRIEPPHIVGAGIAYGGPGTRLTEPESANDLNRRRKAKSFLRAPVVVFDPGPIVYEPIAGYLTKPRDTNPRVKSSLRNFVITTPPVPFYARPIDVTLAPSTKVGRRAKPRLAKPVVVGAGIAFFGPETRLVSPRSVLSIRRNPDYRLSPPAVVNAPFRFFGPQVTRAASTKRARRVHSNLPLVTPSTPSVVSPPISVHLARRPPWKPRASTQSVLRQPVVVSQPVSFSGPRVGYVRSSNLARGTHPHLPTVVYESQVYPGIDGFLAKRKHVQPPTVSRLSPPAVLTSLAVYPPIRVYLADVQDRGVHNLRQRRPKSILRPPLFFPDAGRIRGELTKVRDTAPASHYFLRPPLLAVAAAVYPPISVHLAYSKRGQPKSFLRPPTFRPEADRTFGSLTRPRDTAPPVYSILRAPAVVGQVLAPPIHVTFVRIQPKRTSYRLSRPTVVFPFFARTTDTTLARIRPRPTDYVLRRPTDLVDQADLGYVRQHLAYSRRGTPKSRLRSPVVVFAFIATPIETRLVRIRPPHTIERLAPPSVIDLSPQAHYITTSLAYSRRGTTKSVLHPPTVVTAEAFIYPIRVELARSFRGTPKSILRPPIPPETFPPVSEEVAVQLVTAGLRRRHATWHLSPPAVVYTAVELSGPATTLVRIRPVKTAQRLAPPTVIDLSPQTYYVSINLAYSLRGKPKSILRPPTVTTPAVAYYGPTTSLAPSFRGVPKSFLSPPVPPETFPPVSEEVAVQLVSAGLRRRHAISRLSPPTVVYLAVELSGPEVTLVRIRPPRTIAHLFPPTDLVDRQDVGYVRVHLAPSKRGVPSSFLRPMGSPAVVYAPLVVHLAPSTRIPRAPHFKLQPPTVIDNRPQTYYLSVSLAYSLRGKAKPQLFPPPDIQAEAKAETVLYTSLAYSVRGKPRSKLKPPIVVKTATPYFRELPTTLVRIRPVRTLALLRPPVDTTGLEDQGYVSITLAPSFRGRPKSRLSAPAVVTTFISTPIRVELARIRPAAVHSILRRPTDLVDQADLGRVKVTLARITPPPTHSRLTETRIVYTAVELSGPETSLAPSFRGRPISYLFPPTDLVDQQDFGFVRVHLAPSFRGRPISRLEPPTVVFPFLARAIDTTLVRIRPPHTIAILGRPADTVGIEDQGTVKVTLAYSSRGVPKSKLSAPAVIDVRPQTYYLSVTLAKIKPQPTTTRLAPPTITFPANPPVDAVLDITLARITPPPVFYRLIPPAVVAPVLAQPIAVSLAPQARGKAKPFLRQVIYGARVYAPIRVELAPSRRPKPTSRLTPPTVVARVIYAPVAQHLAYSRRGRAKSTLRQIIYGARVYAPVSATLAPSRLPQTISRLSPPTVLARVVYAPISQHLAYSLRGKPKSILRQTIYGAKVYAPISVTLAPSTRGVAKSLLHGVVVEAFFGRPISVTLVRITPPRTIARLIPPTVVSPFVIPTITVWLAPAIKTKTISRLTLAVEGIAPFRPIKVTLARITPPPTRPVLFPPAVIGAGIYYRGILTHLAYSVRGKPIHRLTETDIVITQCYGIVCGTDSAAQVTGSDSGPLVIGSDAANATVKGSDSSATVTGSDEADGNVKGTDERREGC